MRPTARRRFLARLAALPALAPAAALARPPAPAGDADARFTVEFDRDASGRLLCRARVECPGGTFDRAFAPDALPRGRRFGVVVTPDGIRGLHDPRPGEGR